MKIIFLLIFFCPIFSSAVAQEKGVHFENTLSFKQLTAKAKNENKFLFLDFYASWCGPCKQMDSEVYSVDEVGDSLSKKFLSIKLQIDTTKRDDDFIKSWYSDSRNLFAKYKIKSLPTLMFITPDGDIINRVDGFLSKDDFLKFIQSSQDTSKQFFKLMQAFRIGNKQYEKMPLMISTASTYNHPLAKELARDYIRNYLDTLNTIKLCKRTNLELLNSYGYEFLDTKGTFFRLCYNEPDRINKIVEFDQFAVHWVQALVAKEEILPKLYYSTGKIKNQAPDWRKIQKVVENKYPKTDANYLFLRQKLDYYRKQENWTKLIITYETMIQKYSIKVLGFGLPNGYGADNEIAELILLHASTKQQIDKALGWFKEIEISYLKGGSAVGMYGNYSAVLYKSGRKADAIRYLKLNIESMKNYPEIVKKKEALLAKMQADEKLNSSWKIHDFY